MQLCSEGCPAHVLLLKMEPAVSLSRGALPVRRGPELSSPTPIDRLGSWLSSTHSSQRLCTVCPRGHEDGTRGMQAARRVSPSSCPPPRCEDGDPHRGHLNTAHEPWRCLVTAMSRGCGGWVKSVSEPWGAEEEVSEG